MAHVSLITCDAQSFTPDNEPIVSGDKPAELANITGQWLAAFDDTDEEAVLLPALQMPGHYGGGTLKLDLWVMFASEVTVTDEAVFDVSVEAVTSGDAVDWDNARSFDAVNSIEVDPPATAGKPVKVTVTLANKDAVVAGDHVQLHIRRDTDHANDTATGDACIQAVELWEDT